jgi:aerobic C4-dicarboxylate transport protein
MAIPTRSEVPATRALKPGLYLQVLFGLATGVAVGHFVPQVAVALKPLGDVFISAIKMVISPIVLCTVAVGIARAGDARKVGRLGGKAVLYFEVVSTLALLLGWLVGDTVRPGAGFGAAPALPDATELAGLARPHAPHSALEFLTSLVPDNAVGALARGDLLHVLVFAVLMGFALLAMGERRSGLVQALADFAECLLRVVGFVMVLAPLAAFGAMAFTVGTYGIGSVANLGKLVGCLYLSSAAFVALVLGPVARYLGGVGLWPLIKYIRAELFITLGTASSEVVLPRLMEKLERLGCSRSVVGMVLPAGYSFNLDGTSIYLTLAALFIAQALGIELTLAQQATLFGILLFTSKGIAGVSGAALVVLVATLSATDFMPVAGVGLILGIDRIQSEIRAVTNVIGNVVATIVLARSEHEFDLEKARDILAGNALRDRE